MKKFFILFVLFLLPVNSYALIEVDITRGNLNRLPVAVSPLSIDENSKKQFKDILDKEDVGAELIREHDGGEVADFYNEAQIESAFKKIYNNWKNNIVFNPKRELTSKLHRKHQVEKLKALIHRIITT